MKNFVQRQRRRDSGFTLTEAALVMVIIGVVLTALWTAVAAFNQNSRIYSVSKQLGMISNKARAFYGAAGTNYLDSSIAGTQGATLFAQAGIIPADMVDASVDPPRVYNPWSGDVTVDRATYSTPGDSFTIGLLGLPMEACNALLLSLTGPTRDPLMTAAGTAGMTFVPSDFPLTLTRVSSACGVNNKVSFTFLVRN